jgi:hypothetical protein
MLRSHVQLQLIYEKYRQLVALACLSDDASRIATMLRPTPEDIAEARAACPQSYVLRELDKINRLKV